MFIGTSAFETIIFAVIDDRNIFKLSKCLVNFFD